MGQDSAALFDYKNYFQAIIIFCLNVRDDVSNGLSSTDQVNSLHLVRFLRFYPQSSRRLDVPQSKRKAYLRLLIW
jgi:hypothetical protein